MKKHLCLIFILFAFGNANAQFSFKNMNEKLLGSKKSQNNNEQMLKQLIDSLRSENKSVKDSTSTKYPYEDFLRKIKRNAVGDKKTNPWLFPAFVKGSQRQSDISSYFFDGDTLYQNLFQNSNVLYNPKLRSMTLNTEVVHDYFGAFRVGVGFQINSTVESDSTGTPVEEMDKDKLVSSLQNGGGNIFINLKLPLISLGYEKNPFGLKSYLYHNTGFELTKFNQADDSFLMTNMTGIVLGAYGNGAKNKMSAFLEAKAALIYGNSKFKNILSVDKEINNIIPMTHFTLGLNFSDLYTLKVDMYPLGNYVKTNFPTTVSFAITPNMKQ